VHDYHLLLLPSFILRKLRTASVGLFLHTPFPASEVFRTLPVRDELLRGMLNADLVGFHLFEYARSFLTCCKRMLGLEHEFAPGGFLAVRDGKRTVYVQASHVGIEPETLAPFLRTVDHAGLPPGLEGHAELCEALGSGRALIGGIDECERLRGITLKLLAFEQLLDANPEWRGKVSLVQLGQRAGAHASCAGLGCCVCVCSACACACACVRACACACACACA
jgi:trehalose 6-phosphate synthase/phosphatase